MVCKEPDNCTRAAVRHRPAIFVFSEKDEKKDRSEPNCRPLFLETLYQGQIFSGSPVRLRHDTRYPIGESAGLPRLGQTGRTSW